MPLTLSTAEAGELLDIYHLRKFAFMEWNQLGTLRAEDHAIDLYWTNWRRSSIFNSLRGFRVVIDCCSGDVIADSATHEPAVWIQLHVDQRADGRRRLCPRAFHHARNRDASSSRRLSSRLRRDAGFLFDVDSDPASAMAAEDGSATLGRNDAAVAC